MKQKLLALVAFAAIGAKAEIVQIQGTEIEATTQALMRELAIQNRINWQIGDFHNTEVELGFLGKVGTGRKEVVKEETDQNAIWYKNTVDLMGQKQVVETLIRRSDAAELRRIVNGKEEKVGDKDNSKVEIIEQSETEVTVPAGKFDCLYIKAKVTAEGKTQEIQAWVNPIDVNLDGMLKVIIQSQLGPVTMTLKEFGPRR
jgi:hypothetical protein